MPIRVIAGSAKGRKLKPVPGDSTRPIMDRVKESLFNILGDWVVGSRWIDLFAGTGSVGIEALSRGADHCLFVDNNARAISTILANLSVTGFSGQASVWRGDALNMLKLEPNDRDRAEAIYVAPPQYHTIWIDALQMIDRNHVWLLSEGIVIIQIDPKEFADVELNSLTIYDKRVYGNTMLGFYALN